MLQKQDTILNESVMQLTAKPEIIIRKKPKLYRAKCRTFIKESEKLKFSHRTFGVPEVTLAPPSQFLKKRSRPVFKVVVDHQHYHRESYQRKLPEWKPFKKAAKAEIAELPKDPLTTGRINFRKKNIKSAQKLQPPEPKKRYADTRNGDTWDLISSGLYPVYIHKKSFGKASKKVLDGKGKLYETIEHIGYDMNESGKKIKSEEMEKKRGKSPYSEYYAVTAEERENLLKGMKQRWDEMMTEFQRLPFLTDTVPKVIKKSKMEQELKQLEKDINIIESHPQIYVYNNSEEEN
ncbi:enkurin [Prorops nasuta]|uniref:enkurin n=1 Tax=Prorops nasuta TaxID=863751 RepID=UPI0034CD813B